MFEQAVEGCPAKFAKCEDFSIIVQKITTFITSFLLYLYVCTALYLLYAKLEEEHGLSRHAMAIYDRATKAVPAEEQFEVRTVQAELLLGVWLDLVFDHLS